MRLFVLTVKQSWKRNNMLNWWKEDLHLDWLEICVIAVLMGLSLVCVMYNRINKRRK